MTREEYILQQARELKKLSVKRRKLRDKTADHTQLTQKAYKNALADLNWAAMHVSMCEERIGFALGLLKIEDLREYYEPSSFHKYKGVRDECLKLKFES